MFSHSVTRISSGKNRVHFLVLFCFVVLGFFVGFVCLSVWVFCWFCFILALSDL